jgi:NTE family protein
VATSIVDGSIVVFKEGNLRDAIRASISIPLIFKPVKYQEHILVDGGFSDPVPIDVVKAMGAQRTIGVNLYSNMFPKKLDFDKLSFIDVISSMIDISLYNNSMSNMKNADVQLNLAIDPSTQFTAFGKDPTELIKIGEEAVKTNIDKLRRL